jgi:hypothetical protein
LGYSLNWMRERHEARKWLLEHGGEIWNDGDLLPEDPCRPPLSLRILGEKGVELIWIIIPKNLPNRDDKGAQLKELFPEAQVLSAPPLLPP